MIAFQWVFSILFVINNIFDYLFNKNYPFAPMTDLGNVRNLAI